MESLNMNTLASSLPNSANAEKQLTDNFKAAALSITTLYRSSLDTSKQAYTAGYATCLLDVLHFLEAGVSVSGAAGEEMTIGRVMDWVEARIEAIKSTEEEEEEEEERMKEGPTKVAREEVQKDEREKRIRKVSGGGVTANAVRIHRRSKENLHEAPPNPTTVQPIPSARPPSSSPPAPSLSSPSPPPPPARPLRPKRGFKDFGPVTPLGTDAVQLPVAIPSAGFCPPLTFSSDVVSPVPITGSKRRHAAMISESPASSSVAAVSSPGGAHAHNHAHHYGHNYAGGRRKRGRGGRERDTHHGQNSNSNGNVQGQGYADAMEVEEDGGRERKRVARR